MSVRRLSSSSDGWFSWFYGVTLVACVGSAASCGARLIGETDPFESDGGDDGGGGSSSSGAPTTSGTSSGSTSVSGSGSGGAPVQCTSDGECAHLDGPCSFGVCAGGSCTVAAANEGAGCNDGQACTAGDVCKSGACVGTPLCESNDPCLVGTCGADGSCTFFPKDGGPCEDGNPCTIGDACAGGTCVPGAFVDCSMFDSQCTKGTCTPDGCVAQPIKDGLPCNDGLFCTTGEVCSLGVCTGGVPIDCTGGQQCVIGACDEATDTCVVTVAPDGTPCNDGSACTTSDACSAGTCVGAGPIVYFADDFSDASAGWTLGPEWQIGPAMMSSGGAFGEDPALDHTPTNDNGIAGVVIGGTASTMPLHPPHWLESPPIDTSAAPSVVLSYWRWLNADYHPFMHHYVQVWTGAAWVTVWATGNVPVVDSPPNGSGWTFVQHDLTAYKNAQMRVRFGFDVTAQGAFDVGSWNLDDVTVATAPCP